MVSSGQLMTNCIAITHGLSFMDYMKMLENLVSSVFSIAIIIILSPLVFIAVGFMLINELTSDEPRRSDLW